MNILEILAMKQDKQSTDASYSARRHTVVFLAAWTLVVGAFLGWNLYRVKVDFRQRALMEAWGSSEKDLLIQRWVARQGGVYVPISEEVTPNQYLSYIEDRDGQTGHGKSLTLMNAAYLMRQLYDAANTMGVVQGHFTSLNPIRPENGPDAWEAESLKAFERGATQVNAVETLNGRPYMRLMRPMVTDASCLKCHAHQGYRVGDVRGGFSVSVPMSHYLQEAATLMIPLALGHATIWVLGAVGIAATTQSTGRHIRRINREIAERKQAERQREHLLKTLEAKNEELQSMVYVASHDLKSPLVNIEGFSGELAAACEQISDVLRNEDLRPETRRQLTRALNEDIPEALRFIRAGTGSMLALLKGLLQASRVGTAAFKTETVDMNAMMKRITGGMQFQIANSGAEISVEDLPACRGDSGLLNQVFTNLLANALKYLDPARKGAIRITGRVSDGMAIYCMEDNGRGIAREHQGKIFEIFHRLEPRGVVEGEGLGLTIARRIVARHEGRIWVESEPGKGSRFFVSLPAH